MLSFELLKEIKVMRYLNYSALLQEIAAAHMNMPHNSVQVPLVCYNWLKISKVFFIVLEYSIHYL